MHPDGWLDTLRTRLVARPRADAWIALVIRAFPATAAPDGATGGRDGDAAAPADDDGPPHWLVAGWPPAEGGLRARLPEFAAIASPDRDRALAELFVHLPPGAVACLVTPEVVDAALVAEMVLAVDRNLAPWHRRGLAAFVDAQRAADRRRIVAGYTDREPAFERLRRGLAGDAGP